MSQRNNVRYALDQSPLFKLKSRSKLARLLRISLRELHALAAGDALYREFDIPKKNGGTRHVENPARPLKLVQAKLARLLARVEPPEFLFCPVKGRCYVTNAAAHRHARVVHCLDIKKFFPSTSQRRVFWFFRKVMLCERDIAGLLARLACYQGHLPTGSPLSPLIAYLAYYDLWQRIATYCARKGYKFTLYIDDVTISGSRVPQRDVWEIRQMIHAFGLRYHKRKSFVGKPAEITGVIVSSGAVKAPHRQHKKIRLARALLSETDGEERAALNARIKGISAQIQQIASKN
jgi:hypothetical protein